MDRWYEAFFSEDYWVYARVEYDPERTQREVEYLSAVVASHAPGPRIADVGCGIGRHAIPLAARGHVVWGLDISPWAVGEAARAAKAAEVDASFTVADVLVDPVLPFGEVDAVIAVQAFGWGSDADQLRMLKALRRHLAPGGLLILDFSSLLWLVAHYREHEEHDIGVTHFAFDRHYDAIGGRSRSAVTITGEGGLPITRRDDVRLYSPAEVIALVRAAGFVIERVDADFVVGATVGRDTRYAQVVARAAAVPPSGLGLTTSGRPADPSDLDLRWADDESAWLTPPLEELWTRARDAGARSLDESRSYALSDPYGSARGAPAVSEYFNTTIRPDQLAFGAGVSGLLRPVGELAEGGLVLVEPYGHPDLPAWAAALGCEVQVAPGGLQAAVEATQPALVLVDRPGIAGEPASPAEISELATTCAARGAVVVVDESYANYLPPEDSVVPLVEDHDNLIVLRGFSKGYCWGGLRVGFAVSSPPQAVRLAELLPPLPVAATSFALALELLAAGWIGATLRARIEAIRPGVVGAIEALGFAVAAGHPALPWVLINDPDRTVLSRLADRHVVAKSLLNRGPTPRVRMSIPLSEERLARFAALTA